MNCCNARQCEALEDVFDADYAEDDIKDYRKKGPAKTTRTLLDGIRALGDVRGRSLIDIGGGIGAIQLELLKAGLAASTGVDASAAYLSAAKNEAEKLGYAERTSYQHGNFVERAPDIAPADFVTLDRVICCYPDMHSLVRLSAERARRAYAIVSPRDTWWMRAAEHGLNLWERVQRSAFRFYVHPDLQVDGILSELGFTRALFRTHGPWQVKVWKKMTPYPRADERPDALFYAQPRFVAHIDDAAIAAVTALYRDYLPPGGAILDLMSSWISHLPEDIDYGRVDGLGMNERELAANPRLQAYLVHDLNANPTLPYEAAQFDAVTICVSVDYLTQPVTVFRECGRVTKPGGVIVVTFSNRCFPSKAIAIWHTLDDAGHVQLVADFLQESGVWTDIRAIDASPDRPGSDPLFAVVARSHIMSSIT